MKVTRAARAQLARDAARIRADQQRRGASVPAIAAQIIRDLPITPLEAWRLAYGWSRPHVVEAVTQVYQQDGLAPPGLTTAMLCRWEHGQARPGPDYVHALAQVYQAAPERLGVPMSLRVSGWYGHRMPQQRQEHLMPSEYPELTAVADSIALNGSGAGSGELAEHALDFYNLRYGDYPPAVLAAEVARCRSLLMNGKLRDTGTRRVSGWLSALLGNLAHHTGDASAALIHLGAASRVGIDVGDTWLAGWALGAQSMVTLSQGRPTEALELADQALTYADTSLRRAQIAAWCRLRPLAVLGNREEVARTATSARRHMDTAEDAPGRFGFDRAEFELHLAEALLAGDSVQATDHARTSVGLKRVGSPGWAAATAVLARAHAVSGAYDGAVEAGLHVLEVVPAERMRSTTQDRLRRLVADVEGCSRATELRDAVRGR